MAARRIPDPKVGGSNPSGLILDFVPCDRDPQRPPITPPPVFNLYSHFRTPLCHLPGRGVGLIKKGPRLVWSRIIAL